MSGKGVSTTLFGIVVYDGGGSEDDEDDGERGVVLAPMPSMEGSA